MRKTNLLTVTVLLVIGMLGYLFFNGKHASPDPRSAVATHAGADRVMAPADALPSWLPMQAHETLALITRGGPFPHRQDGAVFSNREALLPQRPRGFYHEYTVVTPGSRTRGARRIITGGTPPTIYYYTDDHYRSFRNFRTGS